MSPRNSELTVAVDAMDPRSTGQVAAEYLWCLLLATLPITSFPALNTFFGSSPVKPFALILIGPLALLLLLDHRKLVAGYPWQLWSIGLFTVIAALSILFAAFLPIIPIKGLSPGIEGIKSFATLLIGLGYLLAACVLLRSPGMLRKSLRAITIGGAVMLFWSSIQATYVFAEGRRVPLILNDIHRLFVDRDLVFNRVSGLAYEPSWLGNQLMVLYLPIWAGSVMSGYSVFRRMYKQIGIESLLLVWGLFILAITQSRISILTFCFVLFSGLLMLGWRLADRVATRGTGAPTQSVWRSIAARAVLLLGLFILFTAILAGLAWGVSKVDRRMSRLLQIPDRLTEINALYPNEVVYEAANRLAFAERLVYWAAAYSAFELYPILGVGLGNSGFLFSDTMPSYGYTLVEVRNVLEPGNPSLANPKNLWVRILAETGILGASAFIVWYVILAVTAIRLSKSSLQSLKMLGMMGILFFLSQIVEGFSIDTFALPYLWVASGLILSGSSISHSPTGSDARDVSQLILEPVRG